MRRTRARAGHLLQAACPHAAKLALLRFACAPAEFRAQWRRPCRTWAEELKQGARNGAKAESTLCGCAAGYVLPLERTIRRRPQASPNEKLNLILETMIFEAHNGELTLSTDPDRLDITAIYSFLSQTYWAKDRPRPTLQTAIRHSLCFGVYREREQIGFARVITDRATFGYLADVYLLEPYRGRGLGRWLVSTILSHPELAHLRRWCLLTRDRHALYRECGFVAPAHPEDYMEKLQPYPPANQGGTPGPGQL